MGVKYVVKAKAGEYKDADGNQKTKYLNIGVVLETQNGFSLKLDCIPTGWDGFAFLSDPEQKGGGNRSGGNNRGYQSQKGQGYNRQNQRPSGSAGGFDDMEDSSLNDVPF